MKRTVWLMLALGTLCLGCQSGHDVNLGIPGGNNLGAIVGEANLDRQLPSADTQAAAISGKLTFSGFTVLNAAGQALNGTSRYSGIMVRLVDPEDDILSTVYPDTQGRFNLTYAGQLTSLRLEIQLTVREDLNGDGHGNELLRQVVPVYLTAGRTATIDWVIRRGQAVDFDQRLLPSKGMTLVAQFTALDGAGQKTQYYATIFATNLAVVDLDGDRFFELGEDLSGADVNHDGWIDEAQVAPAEPAAAVTSTVVGVVVSVDKGLQQMTVRQDNGIEVLVTVPPFTAIEILDKRSNTFLGPIPLDAQLIQNTVLVEGVETPAGMDASWVVVYR